MTLTASPAAPPAPVAEIHLDDVAPARALRIEPGRPFLRKAQIPEAQWQLVQMAALVLLDQYAPTPDSSLRSARPRRPRPKRGRHHPVARPRRHDTTAEVWCELAIGGTPYTEAVRRTVAAHATRLGLRETEAAAECRELYPDLFRGEREEVRRWTLAANAAIAIAHGHGARFRPAD